MNGHRLGRFMVAAGAALTGVAALVVATFMGIAMRTDVFAAEPGRGGAGAEAVLQPTKGHKASGRVEFTKGADGVTVHAQLEGLEPGPHGFHVHENGDCSAPDATSAGAHFNPTSMPHAGPDDAQRHDGDLGNVTADASGKATLHRVDHKLDLSGERSIVGRALILHAQPDDLTSQPSGNAGARVACAVIQAKK